MLQDSATMVSINVNTSPIKSIFKILHKLYKLCFKLEKILQVNLTIV